MGQFQHYSFEFFEKNPSLQFDGKHGPTEILKNKEISIDLESSEFSLTEGGSGPLCKIIEEYKKLYPAVDKKIRKWRLYRWGQLMRYNPGNYYSYEHCENDGLINNSFYCHTRVFAWQLFLNSIEDGGGTYFTHQNFVAKPREGDLYIWPAYWTHMHKGIVAPKETKYIITGWCNFINE